MSRAVVFCFVFFVGYVAGNLIRDDVTTRDIKILRDGIVNKEQDPAAVEEDKNDVEAPAEVFGTELPKKCVEIGQFCMTHGDCCTNACLGYLKKCVSGSG